MQRAKRCREQREAKRGNDSFRFFFFNNSYLNFGLIQSWYRLELVCFRRPIQIDSAQIGSIWHELAWVGTKSMQVDEQLAQVGASRRKLARVDASQRESENKKKRSSDAWVRCCPPHPTSGRIGCRCDTPVAALMLSRLTIRWIKDIKVHWEI